MKNLTADIAEIFIRRISFSIIFFLAYSLFCVDMERVEANLYRLGVDEADCGHIFAPLGILHYTVSIVISVFENSSNY